MKKIILFILNYSTPDNQVINEAVRSNLVSTVEDFVSDQEDIIFRLLEITNKEKLYDLFLKEIEDIRKLTGGAYELYLHFSGHGVTKGQFYGQDLVSVNNLDDILSNGNIKFIFFSNCFSKELAEKVIQNKNLHLCIASEQELEVPFSIEFETLFYSKLLKDKKKSTFLNAFKSTIAGLSKKNKDLIEHDTQGAEKYILHKGGGGGRGQPKQFNKLNCIWNELKEEQKIKREFRLLYDSFSEQVLEVAKEEYLQHKKQILIVYNNDTEEQYLDFLAFIRKENWASVNHIITINDRIINNNFETELKTIIKGITTPEFLVNVDLIN